MLDTQLLDGVLVALAVLIGATVALSLAIVAAAAVVRRGAAPQDGPAPQGGIRRELPEEPTPDTDDDRELVLV